MVQRATTDVQHRHEDEARAGRSIRGAAIVLLAAAMLVGGTYYMVTVLTGPDGWLTHMATSASAEVDGRTATLAAGEYQ
jgi:hypothetical protein